VFERKKVIQKNNSIKHDSRI